MAQFNFTIIKRLSHFEFGIIFIKHLDFENQIAISIFFLYIHFSKGCLCRMSE